jgi:multiple sugar transport system substrate-binding protein
METRIRIGRIISGFLCVLWLAAGPFAQAAELQWWSHWATQDSKKAVLSEVKSRFEAQHPQDKVTLTYYEKANMWPTLRAAYTAGSGFPDIQYFDYDVLEFIPAGWVTDLSAGIRWDNIEPYAKNFWTRPGPGGKTGIWALGVEAASDEIYFNKKMFRQLGISVPADFAFTQDQFKEVVTKCAKAGFAGFSTGSADREVSTLFFPTAILLSKLGGEDVLKLGRGELSWKDARVVDVLRYYRELIDLGLYSRALTSMTLADAHRYFHTEQKACMFPVGSWYTGRAFVPPEKGGQPKDFELGLLNYPLMKDGKGHHQKYLGIGGSYAVAAKSPNAALAIEFLNLFANVDIGNFWMAKTGIQTGIKTDPARIESPMKWYFEEFGKVNKGNKWVNVTTESLKLQMKPGLWEVWASTVGQGLPNKLISPDDAVAKLEEARLKGK